MFDEDFNSWSVVFCCTLKKICKRPGRFLPCWLAQAFCFKTFLLFNRCYHDRNGLLSCDCKHNTAGRDCEKCKAFHFDRPWARATAQDAHECIRKCLHSLQAHQTALIVIFPFLPCLLFDCSRIHQ